MKLRKKALSLVLTGAMIVGMFAGFTVSASAATTITDLSQITNMSGDYKLADSVTTLNINASTWTPIGTSSAPFTGTFDGNGKTINWTGTSTSSRRTLSSNYFGIFGVSKGTVSNLNVTGSIYLTGSSKDYVSPVVGYNSGTINGVTNNATLNCTGSIYNVGGIVGFNNGYYDDNGNAASSGLEGIIVNCINSGTIQGYSKVGGIAGENSGTISFCGNTGSVTSTYSSKTGAGGIAGRNGNNNTAKEKGKIFDCYNRGAISVSSGKWCGGITGFNNSLSIVKNCYNTGTYTGNSYYNPIIGNNENYTLSDEDNYASTSTGTGTAIEKGTYTINMNSDTFRALLEENASQSGVWTYSSSVNGGYPYGNGTAVPPEPSSYGANNSYSIIYLDGTNGSDSNAGNTTSTAVATLGKAVALADNSSVSNVYVALLNPVTISNTQAVYGGGVTVKWAKNSTTGPMFTLSSGGNLTIGGVSFNGQYSSSVNVDTGFSVGNGASLTLRNNASITNCGTAVNVNSGGTLTVNKASITGTTYSIYNSGTFKLNAYGTTTSISGNIYLASGKYITLGAAVPSSGITVQAASPSNNLVIAQSDGIYTITDTDKSRVSSADEDYAVDRSGNTLILVNA